MTHSRLKRLLASVLAAAMVLSLSVSGTYAVESDSRIPVSFEEMDPDEVSAERMNSQSPIEEGSSFHADNDPVQSLSVQNLLGDPLSQLILGGF